MTPERCERVKQLFDEALEREPTSQDAFLDAACQGDQDLRAKVEQLLAEYKIGGRLMERPLLSILPVPIAPGTRLGPYEILSAIGAGGMGEVYRARDTRLKRTVAIKVLPGYLSNNPKARARFEREAQAVARLSHPHICALYDVGNQDGVDYLVMEYLEGETLAHNLSKGPLLPAQLLRYGIEIADALAQAHRQGVIHRDLKPGNIMLTTSGSKLLDFGVAKQHVRGEAISTISTVTLTTSATTEGALVGTLAYMSPEQARGEELDARTDLFSFGAVLYEMATGKRAFRGATPAVLIDALLHLAPTPPRQINRGIPEKIENIIGKALEKGAELRYQTATEMRDDLASVPEVEISRVATVCPYRGLRSFRYEDAEFFAGREAFAERLMETVLSRKLVALVGPSGSGKSSVVQAGLVPLLRRLPDSEKKWGFISFTPGISPFDRLVAAIMPLMKPLISETDRLTETQKLANRLTTREVLLEQLLPRVLGESKKVDRLLITADQFEELFTMTPESKREPFVTALLSALAGGSTSVLLVMRADFYGHAITLSRGLSDRLEQSVLNLGPMVGAETKRALLQPAGQVGLEFERGLVERILNEAGAEPGNLPLLEFALTELWERRQGALLTHRAYEEIGAVGGAIAKRAEAEFAKLTPEQQMLAPRVFTRLVHVAHPGEGGEDTRQRTDLDDLSREAHEVIRVFAAARLVVTSRDESTGRQVVEVAHEALIWSWQRLQRWVNEDREFLLWRQRLRVALAEWQRGGRSDEAVLPRHQLMEAKAWIDRRVEDVTPEEKTFIERSQQRHIQDEQRWDQLSRKAALQGKGAKQAILVLLEVLLLLSFALAVVVWIAIKG